MPRAPRSPAPDPQGGPAADDRRAGIATLLDALRRRQGISSLAPGLVRAAAEFLADGARIVAVGWATVDLERTAREAGDVVTRSPGPPDALLGARSIWVRLSGQSPPAAPPLHGPADALESDRSSPGIGTLLLEPATEGRLAAFLARYGEGPCALYLEPGAPPADAGSSRASMMSERRTALGRPGAVVRGQVPWGPFVILLRRDASPWLSEPAPPSPRA